MPPPIRPEALWSCDSKSIQLELLKKTPHLFATEADHVEIWKTPTLIVVAGVDYIEQRHLNEQDLTLLWDHNRQFRDIFYIVEQGNSWDRLLVTKETWASLIAKHNVFPYFTESVLTFGLREKDDNNTWNNFHSRDPLNGSGDMETCYTIRFPEKNHIVGETGDSWSLRQTAVYHRMHSRSFSSVWILVKPSPDLKCRLPEKLNAFWYDEEFRYARHPLTHVMILFVSLYGWHDYMATQSSKIEQFEGKSFFPDADTVGPNDYRRGFEDLQSLQRLRRELSKATSVLDSTADLSRRIRNIIPKMTVHMRRELTIAIFEELDDFDAEIKYIRSYVMELKQRSSDAADLLLSVSEHRNGNLSLRRTLATEASQMASTQSLSVMTGIAVNGELKRELEKETSSNIRTLMIVAVLYLPISLLAGIFSSNRIDSDSGVFIDARAFWKSIIVLVPVSIATFSAMFVLQNVYKYGERDIPTRKARWRKGWKEMVNIACLSKS
ncbi:hypothetical protein F4781DRAFT_311125 [Annulohypoxylon bovei var. microspora]|nr:hypothetical protein F4781DRAFT_311125 [Annulohypoxylon bovei var. microspora]